MGVALLSRQPGIDRVDFRQPGGKTRWRDLTPGKPLLLKLPAASRRESSKCKERILSY